MFLQFQTLYKFQNLLISQDPRDKQMLAVLNQSGFTIFSSVDVNYESTNHNNLHTQKNETEPV